MSDDLKDLLDQMGHEARMGQPMLVYSDDATDLLAYISRLESQTSTLQEQMRAGGDVRRRLAERLRTHWPITVATATKIDGSVFADLLAFLDRHESCVDYGSYSTHAALAVEPQTPDTQETPK